MIWRVLIIVVQITGGAAFGVLAFIGLLFVFSLLGDGPLFRYQKF